MIKPYEKTYLEDVTDNLGSMLEYAVGCGLNPFMVWESFVSSRVAMEIENGNPKFIAGYSSRDYLDIVLNTLSVCGMKLPETAMSEKPCIKNDIYYWAGFAIASLQYETGLSFYDINKFLPLKKILSWYPTLHEADIKKFLDIAQIHIKKENPHTNLKIIRRASGLTQQQLAKQAQVELRSIQMYEQRRNDINKAQVNTLFKLAKALGCKIEDLIER